MSELLSSNWKLSHSLICILIITHSERRTSTYKQKVSLWLAGRDYGMSTLELYHFTCEQVETNNQAAKIIQISENHAIFVLVWIQRSDFKNLITADSLSIRNSHLSHCSVTDGRRRGTTSMSLYLKILEL